MSDTTTHCCRRCGKAFPPGTHGGKRYCDACRKDHSAEYWHAYYRGKIKPRRQAKRQAVPPRPRKQWPQQPRPGCPEPPPSELQMCLSGRSRS